MFGFSSSFDLNLLCDSSRESYVYSLCEDGNVVVLKLFFILDEFEEITLGNQQIKYTCSLKKFWKTFQFQEKAASINLSPHINYVQLLSWKHSFKFTTFLKSKMRDDHDNSLDAILFVLNERKDMKLGLMKMKFLEKKEKFKFNEYFQNNNERLAKLIFVLLNIYQNTELVHYDLHEDNIVVLEDDTIQVIDFGNVECRRTSNHVKMNSAESLYKLLCSYAQEDWFFNKKKRIRIKKILELLSINYKITDEKITFCNYKNVSHKIEPLYQILSSFV
jgi:hypothetical protein